MKSQKNRQDSERIQLGRKGEELAGKFLLAKGYEIVDRNWRYRHKEIDIIARMSDELIFVEVRTRSSRFGNLGPEATIGKKKQAFLIEAAKEYLYQEELDFEIRFDVIAILMHSYEAYQIKHLEDAFFPRLE